MFSDAADPCRYLLYDSSGVRGAVDVWDISKQGRCALAQADTGWRGRCAYSGIYGKCHWLWECGMESVQAV